MMTVKMMIDLLKIYPEDLRVVISGYEQGWDDLSLERISVVPVALGAGKNDWDGQHLDDADFPAVSREAPTIAEVLALRRTSN